MRKTVCILGMHRSGTSCLTGSLEQHGLYLGEVINSAPHNRKGNKENSDTWAINDAVLEKSGGSWDKPPEQLSWDDGDRQEREKYIERFEFNNIWGFKDPRTLLTLPFWLEGLPELSLIGTFRHPILVASSLGKRNKFSFDESLELWNYYNQRLIYYWEEFNFPVICFDLQKDDYLKKIKKIAQKLEVPENVYCSESNFFDTSLRTEPSLDVQNHIVPNKYLATYEKLCDIAL